MLALLPIAASAATLTIPAGTQINVTLDNTINSGTAQVGDGFTAHVQAPLPDPSLAGAVISGQVVQVQQAGQGTKPAIGLQFNTIQLYDGTQAPIEGYLVSAQQRNQQKSGARVVATTLGGMLVGNAIGKTVFGSASTMGSWLGALSGFLIGQNYQANIQIPQNAPMVVQLNQNLSIRRQAGY
ncbi:MAG: hypothetical protein JO177_01885 [Candidatus Eremiobacteraeota bacterium]|nr:hypothetical protein [Candidatus Eremiobacteraeota bacterium]